MKLPFYKARKKQHSPANLNSSAGRRRAERELVLGDHGFLRETFQNLHQISHEMWRSNQPNPRQIEEHRRVRQIRTIINLRGPSTKGYYLLEKEACEAHDITLIDFQVYSRQLPAIETVLAARKLFETIEYPALMHCKSGADRAGLMSALYMLQRQKTSLTTAQKQLSKRYLHLREGKTGLLDAFFEAFADQKSSAEHFEDWLRQSYDPATIKQAFLNSRAARLNLDWLLRRE